MEDIEDLNNDKPVNRDIEKSSEENISDVNADNHSSNQITENMEVHHHPQVEKKSFKEYLLEGLMIFFAVSMGFIAENIREHISEHNSAKILAQSMLEDLKKDTSSLKSNLIFGRKKLNSIDSLVVMLHQPRDKWNDTNFYRNMMPITTTLPFFTTNGTYEQMKTSGTMRYFKQLLINQMNAYAVQLKKTEYRDDVESKGTWIVGPYNFDVINTEVISDIRFNLPITHEMYIKIADKSMLDKLVNMVVMIKSFRTRTQMEVQEQLNIAIKLIDALNKEYHFDN